MGGLGYTRTWRKFFLAHFAVFFSWLRLQIHRHRRDSLFGRKLQRDSSEVRIRDVWRSLGIHLDKYELNSFQSRFRCFQMVNILWFVFSSNSSSVPPESRVNLDFNKWSNDGELGIMRQLSTVPKTMDVTVICSLVCVSRKSVYKQWRETGWQCSRSHSNLQKRWDRDVSLLDLLLDLQFNRFIHKLRDC